MMLFLKHMVGTDRAELDDVYDQDKIAADVREIGCLRQACHI